MGQHPLNGWSDEATWGPPTGHPHDPRTEEADEEAEEQPEGDE